MADVSNHFAQIPKVYYDVREDLVSLPSGGDDAKALQTLQAAGIAPGCLRIRVINSGQVVAKQVKIGVQTTGAFMYVRTDPATRSKAVWVKVTSEPLTGGDREAAIQLSDLVPNKTVSL